MQSKRKLLMLWLRQQQCCAMCRHKITKETGWNIHYIVERVKGGGDELSNLVLLHLIVIGNCMLIDARGQPVDLVVGIQHYNLILYLVVPVVCGRTLTVYKYKIRGKRCY